MHKRKKRQNNFGSLPFFTSSRWGCRGSWRCAALGQRVLHSGFPAPHVAEATVGEGKVVLLGPEVNFRDQPHGTYKLLFNALYYGNAKAATIQ
jgi:hypothetical protein